MIDVLVTQHSKWTARRIRRALFGQSLVDFSADPWRGANDQKNFGSQEIKKRAKKKLSRLELEFSQTESQPSQATTLIESTQLQNTNDTAPIDTTESDLDFQQHSFQPNFQPSFQCPYFPNEQIFQQSSQYYQHHFHNEQTFQEFQHSQQSFPFSHLHFPNEPYPQEHVFSTSFLEPALNQTSSRY